MIYHKSIISKKKRFFQHHIFDIMINIHFYVYLALKKDIIAKYQLFIILSDKTESLIRK